MKRVAVSMAMLMCCQVASADLTTGLVGHWNFDGNTLDSSGNHLDGIGVGTVAYVRGITGQAMKFDGTSTYVNAGHSPLLNVNQHSLVAWINLNGGNGEIIGKVKPFIHESIEMGIKGNYFQTKFATEGELNHTLLSSKALSTGQWHQVVTTYDGTFVRFYTDGVLTDSALRNGTVRTNTNDLAIGRHGGDINQFGDDAFFNGLIDEVRIYNRALSDAEVQGLFTAIPQVVSTDCLFNWAEKNYGILFSPIGAATQSYPPFTYRYYKNANAFLGVSSINNDVYYLGSNGVLQDVGALSGWLASAKCQ